MASHQGKLFISAKSALLFGLVNHPMMQKHIQTVPHIPSKLTSFIVFFVVTFLSMLGSSTSLDKRLDRSFYAALVFYLFSSEEFASMLGDTSYTLPIQMLAYCITLIALMYL